MRILISYHTVFSCDVRIVLFSTGLVNAPFAASSALRYTWEKVSHCLN